MGFKTDTSFLRFLTMGAVGAKDVMRELSEFGFSPIELERYCTTNKIWSTKVKRLRLPDLLCTKTGLRIEVRAKSALAMRMSDAPQNPDRTWDAGLRPEDVIAFVALADQGGSLGSLGDAQYFAVQSFRDCIQASRLGQPKSASEGAERDRTWPSTVPKSDGIVVAVNSTCIKTEMRTGNQQIRRQTFRLADKRAYVAPGDSFTANAMFLAGAPAFKANLLDYLKQSYDPLASLGSMNTVDRYAAVKALRVRVDLVRDALPALEQMIETDSDQRVALEAAGVAALIGSKVAEDYIRHTIEGDGRADLRMEAVFILTENADDFALRSLRFVAADDRFAGEELRQAAVWGLGKDGLASYADLLPFIDDDDENVAFHAICAFGCDAPSDVIDELVGCLSSSSPRRAAAASEVLQLIGGAGVLNKLVESASRASGPTECWIIATIGRLPLNEVRGRLAGSELLQTVEPILLLNEGSNWLTSDDHRTDLGFLRKQRV